MTIDLPLPLEENYPHHSDRICFACKFTAGDCTQYMTVLHVTLSLYCYILLNVHGGVPPKLYRWKGLATDHPSEGSSISASSFRRTVAILVNPISLGYSLSNDSLNLPYWICFRMFR